MSLLIIAIYDHLNVIRDSQSFILLLYFGIVHVQIISLYF